MSLNLTVLMSPAMAAVWSTPCSGTAKLDLTISEFALLKEMIAHPGEVMERDQLMRNVFHRPWSYEDRSLDVLVARLRRKLEPAGGSMRIGSVRGTGYVLSGSTLQ
jgi:DNA-binding response OmpR family regulator